MNYLNSLRTIAVAGLIFAAPTVGMGKDHGSGKHNSGNWNHGSGTYYAPNYGYRPYPYYRPSVSIGVYSSPTYYATPAYGYGSGAYADDLAVSVQRALARRGFYRGAIDGDVGPGTRAAIRAYQYNSGLSVTGRIDRSLVRSLGVG